MPKKLPKKREQPRGHPSDPRGCSSCCSYELTWCAASFSGIRLPAPPAVSCPVPAFSFSGHPQTCPDPEGGYDSSSLHHFHSILSGPACSPVRMPCMSTQAGDHQSPPAHSDVPRSRRSTIRYSGSGFGDPPHPHQTYRNTPHDGTGYPVCPSALRSR